MVDTLADHAPDAKKPRLDSPSDPPEAGSTREPAPDGAAAVQCDDSSHTLVAVPVVGDQISSNDLLPALQQLLSVYQVEYWALLEELRVKHVTVAQVPVGDGDSAQAAGATAGSGSTQSMQELWQAAISADGAGKAVNDAAAQQSPRQQQQQQQQDAAAPLASPFAVPAYGDQRCGYAMDGSEQQQQQQEVQPLHQVMPSLVQAEQLLQQLHRGGQDVGSVDAQQLVEWRQRFQAVAPSVAGLEQLASAASMQYMDAQGGLASLCGQTGRWVLRRSAASIGRSTDAKGDVDIDLGSAAGDAGVGSKVSRLQAQLLLTADGQWSLHNTGRAPLVVNGKQVSRGATVQLTHLSLLEVAGLPLLFLVNSLAVQRAVSRSVHLAM